MCIHMRMATTFTRTRMDIRRKDGEEHERQPKGGMTRDRRQHQSDRPENLQNAGRCDEEIRPGKDGRTIRTRSERRLPQWAEAVRRNIPASASRSDVHQPNANGA